MATSALDKAISTVEKQISGAASHAVSLEFWLTIWTFIVVVGVALEVIAIVREYREDRNAWRRATIRSPEKPSPWFFAFQLFAAVMVAVGVAGELWVGITVGDVNADLRNKSGRLVALVRQQAGDAEQSAGAANERASANELKAQRLSKQAQDEAMARLQLRRQMLPRRLTSGQAESLAEVLREEQGAVAVVCAFGDKESFDLADDINRTIHDQAHWETHEVPVGSWIDSRYGVFVGTLHGTTIPQAALLMRALQSARVPHEFMDIRGVEVNTIPGGFQSGVLYLMVGTHPPIPSEK